MANSTDVARRHMLDVVGVSDVAELFEQIPSDHLLSEEIQLEPALRSEVALRRHLMTLLGQNDTCEENLSFLGAGCWQHHVPAICDEVWSRSEFLTSVWGTPSSDHGRNQAWFEFASQLGELLQIRGRAIGQHGPEKIPSELRALFAGVGGVRGCWRKA